MEKESEEEDWEDWEWWMNAAANYQRKKEVMQLSSLSSLPHMLPYCHVKDG